MEIINEKLLSLVSGGAGGGEGKPALPASMILPPPPVEKTDD
ncbi:hypothetical protein [Pseudoalteromonas rubra]|nr:hypothetical protein [Pseudoalteromonas rubra]